ncbi:MAG: beta-lactamase family protein [Myxococcales bacterium]|nr:beta-lactamase family protein [Myxococcales bacterium]
MFRFSLALVLAAGCSPEARYQRTVDRAASPGAQLVVRAPTGSTWAGASGVAEQDTPMTVDHGFLVGSNTKMMTATVILQLVDEGTLSLDDSAAGWVEGLDPAITVRDLLRHTSGLGDYFEADEVADAADQPWSPQTLITYGQQVRDDGPQSTGTYANTNFIAAGLIIESLEGRPLDEVFEERLFAPLGMHDSGLLLTGDPIPGHLAQGDGGEHGQVTRWDASVGWAAGSAYATGTDLLRFLDAVVDGELLSDELHEAQLAPLPTDLGFEEEGVTTAYGLGVMVVQARGQTILGHLGGVDGFTTASFADPDTGARVVLLANGTGADVVGPAIRALSIAGSKGEAQ